MLGIVRARCHAYAVEGWGAGEVWVAAGVVVQHALAGSIEGRDAERVGAAEPTRLPTPLRGGASPPDSSVDAHRERDGSVSVPSLCGRIARHLAGERVTYEDVAIDVEWATALQLAMAEALRSVPWGEVVSYGELAALAGRPRAARAAGALCADNRFALIVPCHRVVAATGIGGYGTAGVAVKRRLLQLEGVTL
jgi:methylated-DNA-[protein]-cysteine S-methyltransferase